MNTYEEIYKMKSNLSVHSKDEISSLNNNFEAEENQKDLEYFSLFHDTTNSKSYDFEYEFGRDIENDKDLSNLSQEMSSPFDLDNTSVEHNNFISVKHQKDIGNSLESCEGFWQKDNKNTQLFKGNPWFDNKLEQQANEQDFNLLNFDFKFPDFTQNQSFKIKQIDEELRYVDEWVNSLMINKENYSEKDIEVDQPEISEPNRKMVSLDELKQNISNSKSINGLLDAAFYSWSQNQSSHEALEGTVDENSTKLKGTSDKKFNALSIRRSCFRALSAYYKGTFSKFNRAWQVKRRNKNKTKDMDKLIDTYMRQEFKGLLENFNEAQLSELRNALIAILHSHRYKKEEDFTRDTDFSVIRDVLYSYTLDARDRFVKDPAYALTFQHFYIKGGNEFINSKAQCKSSLYAFELNSLNEDAIHTLQ